MIWLHLQLRLIEVKTLTIAEAMGHTHLHAGIPTFFHGAPGVGKSGLPTTGSTGKIGFRDIRVGTMLPESLTGIPVPDLESVWQHGCGLSSGPMKSVTDVASSCLMNCRSGRQLQSCIYRVA